MIAVSRQNLLTAVLLVLALAAGVWLLTVVNRDAPEATTPLVRDDGSYRVGTFLDGDGEAAVAAAVDALPVALSYDYRTLDKSLESATDQMTEDFAARFTETFDATTRSMATEKEAITSALVRGAGLVDDASDGKATVLVYLDQVLVSSNTKESKDPLQVSQNRVHVALRMVDGDWLVDDIDPF